jgi:uncharacterized protein (DUF302 family)
MAYYFNKSIQKDFETSKALVTELLKTEGFGIVSEIDLQAKFKEKLGVDFKKYLILGACNPGFAYKAVQTEEKIGVMLPCNIVLIDQGNGSTEVIAVDPVASMIAVENVSLQPLAGDVAGKLKNIIENLN